MPDSPPLFPLALTPFEHYMWLDDRPAYPMTFVIQQRFRGVVDRAAFEESLAEVLAQHPLLTARIDTQHRIPVWQAAPDPFPGVDWGTWGTPLKFADAERIDLTREMGLRVWVRHDDERTEITTQYHHACTDGVGAFQFLGDLLAHYGLKLNQSPAPQRRTIVAERLRERGRIHVEPPETGELQGFWPGLWSRIRETVQVLRQRPGPLMIVRDEGTTMPFPGICHATLDSRPLRQAAKRAGVTVNDLLLRDLMLTLRDWNVAAGSDGKLWLRITMPTNLRGLDDRESPVANRLGYAFISRRERDCEDPSALLASIKWETEAIKRLSLGAYFLDTVSFIRKVPGAMRLFSSSRRCFATTVLTNLGDPTRRFVSRLPRRDGRVVAGNLVLEQTVGVPPLRPQTRVVCAVFAHRSELTFAMRCDPHHFTDRATRNLLHRFTSRLDATGAGVEEPLRSTQRA